MLLVLSLALVALLVLNAFFVLAEFAVVKVRPSRVAELEGGGDPRASVLRGIQEHLDEYLSVCQIGITLASVALGMVGKKGTDLIMGGGNSTLRYAIAIAVSYIIVSGSHIVIGELVPKSVAIRVADRAALRVAAPLRFFHWLFFPALWLLTHLANAILRLFGIAAAKEDAHSEEELRIILDDSQERGMMTFRRLLFMENVFDLGDLVVRDAMRPRGAVRLLDVRRPWGENLALIRATRLTRYPVITDDPARPSSFLHIKDLIIHPEAPDLGAVLRPLLATTEDTPLEALFAEMQRRRTHAALVLESVGGPWTGLITLEDVLEELVGTIRDEFEEEAVPRLADLLTLDHVQLDVGGESAASAVRQALGRVPAAALPQPLDFILRGVDKGRLAGTYLGQGVALPHARIPGLGRPVVLILRSAEGVPCDGTTERGHILFVLLTPAGQPRIHQILQSTIATLLHESEYVRDRLGSAATSAEVLEVIRTGEQAVLD